MIERDFHHAKRSEAVGFSHGGFGFVVQALDDAAGIRVTSTETPNARQVVAQNIAQFDTLVVGQKCDFLGALFGPVPYGGPRGEGIKAGYLI